MSGAAAVARAVKAGGHDDPWEMEVWLETGTIIRGAYVTHNEDEGVLELDVREDWPKSVRHYVDLERVVTCAVRPD